MKPARYIFINREAGMSPGKIAAQAAHSETLAVEDYFRRYHNRCDESLPCHDPVSNAWAEAQYVLWAKWFGDGHYAKYVMSADGSGEMFAVERYLKERGFKTYLVIDEGHTEGTYMVPTALSVELVDKEDPRITSIFSTFRLYREKPPEAAPSIGGFPGTFLRAIRRG